MNEFTNWKDITMQSLTAMGEKIMTELPNVFGALLVLLIGWIVSKGVIFILKRILKIIRVDKLTKKVNDLKLFGNVDFKFKVTNTIVLFVKWVLFLLFLIIAADIMKWTFVSREIGNLLRYLPQLFSAIALFMIGIYVAKFVKRAIQGFYESFDLAGSKIISNLVFYVIAIIVTITSLNQAGIDTTVVTNNVTVILGAFLLAIAIGFGLGSREIITDLLRSFYSRKTYAIGDKVIINDIKGTIEGIDNICMTLSTDDGKIILPIKDVVESKVKILSN